MTRRLYFYVVVANSIFAKGIENLIRSTICDEAPIECKESLKVLGDQGVESSAAQIPVFIYDSEKFSHDDFNSLLKLMTDCPALRILILSSQIKLHDIKVLLEIGVSGIINNNITPELFTEYVGKTIAGEKVLSQDFCKLIVDDFCLTASKVDHNGARLQASSYNPASQTDLTSREKQVLGYICDGKSTREISEDLFLSLHTVETHRRRILNKLGVKNTAAMVKSAIKSNLYII